MKPYQNTMMAVVHFTVGDKDIPGAYGQADFEK